MDEQTARELTAHWIEPSTIELTRFATGHDRNPGSIVDWKEFIAELDACQPYAAAHADPEERRSAFVELSKLMEYALTALEEELN
jgi:hypothetical protein